MSRWPCCAANSRWRADSARPGIAALRDAVAAEDTLNYNEPPDWPLPVRPYLGAALLDAGAPKEAAAVYAEDLAKYPGQRLVAVWPGTRAAQARREPTPRDSAAPLRRGVAVGGHELAASPL